MPNSPLPRSPPPPPPLFIINMLLLCSVTFPCVMHYHFYLHRKVMISCSPVKFTCGMLVHCLKYFQEFSGTTLKNTLNFLICMFATTLLSPVVVKKKTRGTSMTILDIESASSFWKESFELSKELYYLNFIISARYCCK